MQFLDLGFVVRVIKVEFVCQGDYKQHVLSHKHSDENTTPNVHFSGIRKCINESNSGQGVASATITKTRS
jgi:hypothetical protein